MSISKLTDKELDTFIENYRRNGVTEGGRYTLGELLIERMNRTPTPFPPAEVARKIIELARQSRDGKTTYLELWKAFRPGVEWQGNASGQVVGHALARVIAYCVRHRLPLLTVLVVQSGSRRLAPLAIKNIYNEAKLYGLDVGLDPDAFVEEQARLALAISEPDLPQME